MAQTKKKSSAKKTTAKNQLRANAETEQRLLTALSAITTRAAIAARLGKSFGGDRDIYTALGYKTAPDYKDYMAKYRRQDIARAIINAPVSYSWRKPPMITESDTDETPFEKAWEELVKKRHVFHYMARADRLARIGSYAVLMLGTDDPAPFDQELTRTSELLYLMPYSMDSATIAEHEQDKRNERFGLPKSYRIQVSNPGLGNFDTKVHHSRIIHVAEDKLEDNISGMPALEAVLNRLQDLDMVAGGSSEMFWRGGFPGTQFDVRDEYNPGDQELSELQDQVEEYMHGLKRYLRTKGVDINTLSPQVADPSNHIDGLITLIACATRIPKRILLGSERGQLASSQDEQAWLSTIHARREQHCEPTILRPFIDRLIETGILPEPSDGYTVEWPDLMTPSDEDVAKVGERKSKALKNYMDSGAGVIMPEEIFFEKIMGMSKEDIERNTELLEEIDREVGPGPDEDRDVPGPGNDNDQE